MRRLLGWLWIAVLMVGCGSSAPVSLTGPTASTLLPTPGAPQPPPPPGVLPIPFDAAIPLAFGTTVTDRVADDDPSCGEAYPYRCRYFRVAVPHDGVLVVTIRWNFPASYPFDLGVYGPTGPVADGQIGVGLDRTARGRVIGGTSYLIEVWSFLTPSGSFELSTSIEAR